MRNTTVPSEFEELLEINARTVDAPIRQIRGFVQTVSDQIARIPLLIEEAQEKGATKESPMTLTLALHVSLDPEVQEQLSAELKRLS